MTAMQTIFTLGFALGSLPCFAQTDYPQYGTPLTPAAPDPAIAKALMTIQPASIQQTIESIRLAKYTIDGGYLVMRRIFRRVFLPTRHRV